MATSPDRDSNPKGKGRRGQESFPVDLVRENNPERAGEAGLQEAQTPGWVSGAGMVRPGGGSVYRRPRRVDKFGFCL